MDELMRVPAVSQETGIPEATLRFYRATGQGPKSTKIGRRIVYRRSDVEAWIEAHFEAAG